MIGHNFCTMDRSSTRARLCNKHGQCQMTAHYCLFKVDILSMLHSTNADGNEVVLYYQQLVYNE